MCESCLCNKSQHLPFGEPALESRGPLDLIYTNVWGPSLVQSIDGFHCYIIFFDYFTKYVWLCPLCLKYDVFTNFHQYKVVVERLFHHSIVSIYSESGGEYTALKDFLAILGIQHLKTPPYTPQHNGTIERRHKYIVNTGLTLLSQAKLPLKY